MNARRQEAGTVWLIQSNHSVLLRLGTMKFGVAALQRFAWQALMIAAFCNASANVFGDGQSRC